MINRILIRLKVIQILYETLISQTDDDNQVVLIHGRKSLEKALNEAYKLYIALLWLAVELTRERERQIDAAKHKYLPSQNDLNPNMRFVKNELVKEISENQEIKKFLNDNPVDWDYEPNFLKNLLSDITNSPAYKDYMEKPTVTYRDDCELWKKLYADVIFQSDAFNEELENKSIYWNDDLLVMGTFVIKSIRQAANSKDSIHRFRVLSKYKDQEDENFGMKLFSAAFLKREDYKKYIDEFISEGWDPERIALMDVVILIVAIAELENFPEIPIPVTMNEYTEIASDYSHNKSGQFINGLLVSVSSKLKKEGKIFK